MCVAIPGRVLSLSDGPGGSRPAVVAFPGGIERQVDLVMVPEADVDDYVVAHSGFAISLISKEEADKTVSLLAESQKQQP